MLIFLSYEGFELIANASDRIRDPKRTLPLAYYGSIVSAMTLYVLIVVVAIGHLSFEALSAAQDHSVAAAARDLPRRLRLRADGRSARSWRRCPRSTRTSSAPASCR